MKAAQVLDMQADLLNRLDNVPAFEKVIKTILASALETVLDPDLVTRNVDVTYSSIKQHVRLAYAYRVSDEMSMLVQHSATKLDESDRLDRDLAPTPWGIVRFDRPLPIIDARGGLMQAHWMTWGPATGESRNAFGVTVDRPGLVFSWWNDLADPDPYALKMFGKTDKQHRARVAKALGRWALDGAEMVVDGSRMGGPRIDVPLETQARLLAEGATPEPFTNTSRYAHALFLLLNQTIVTSEEEALPKAAKARIGRMPIPGRVTVVKLRRKAGQSSGETLVQWSHRWLVRDYWRWQHYGPGNSKKARILVHGHLKGPADAPLVLTTKVYDLSR